MVDAETLNIILKLKEENDCMKLTIMGIVFMIIRRKMHPFPDTNIFELRLLCQEVSKLLNSEEKPSDVSTK